MTDLKARSILAIIATLMLVSQAVAMTSGFGGSNSMGSAGVSSSMDLGTGAQINSQDTLSLSGGLSLESSGLYKLDGSDWIDRYSAYKRADGKIWAAVYAYMDQPTTYEYSAKGGVCGCGSIVALESIKAENANNILYGGFAYNEKDYAAVQVAGSADKIVYSNLVGGTSKKAVASQDFSGEGANLRVFSWAERGNFVNELSADKSTADYYSAGVYGPPTAGVYERISQQWAILSEADIESYSSYANSNANSFYVTQDAALNGADSAKFSGSATIGSETATSLSEVSNGIGQSYSAKTVGTSSKLEAIQSLKADSVGSANLAGEAKTEKGSGIARVASNPVTNALKLSYSSNAKNSLGKLAATQSLKADSVDSAAFAAIAQTSDGKTIATSDVSKAVKLSYSSSVQDSAGALTASQTAKANSAGKATFDGAGEMGAEYAVSAGAQVISGESVSYSSKTQDSKGVLTATQSLSAKKADSISRTATSESGKGTGQYYSAKASVLVKADSLTPTVILANMNSGSDTVTSKAGTASAVQKINANGGSIFRDIQAGDGTLHVQADTSLFEGARIPAKASSLSGQSSVTIGAAGVSLKGSWRAVLAQDLTVYAPGDDQNSFRADVSASNGVDTALSTLPKSSADKAISFWFKEAGSAKASNVQAAVA